MSGLKVEMVLSDKYDSENSKFLLLEFSKFSLDMDPGGEVDKRLKETNGGTIGLYEFDGTRPSVHVGNKEYLGRVEPLAKPAIVVKRTKDSRGILQDVIYGVISEKIVFDKNPIYNN